MNDEIYDYLSPSKFYGVKKRLEQMLEEKEPIPKCVGCIYGLFQDYIISEEQENELYEIADPNEFYNNCHDYWNELTDNPLKEVLM